MTIAVNISFAETSLQNYFRYFAENCIALLAAKFPEHDFIFIINSGSVHAVHPEKNIRNVPVRMISKKNPAHKILHNYRLANILQKNSVDCLINCADNFCGQTDIPQLLFMPYTDFSDAGGAQLKKYKKIIDRAAIIISGSDQLKKDISIKAGVNEKKIAVIYSGTVPKQAPSTKEIIKERYTNGKEYFLSVVESSFQQTPVTLLKAFSIFKKMQKSNMQLILACTDKIAAEKLTDNLKNYKYRNDVIVLFAENLQVLEEVTSAAYAVIHLSQSEFISQQIIEAMSAGAPVIAGSSPLYTELFNNSLVFTDNSNITAIADKMMLLFKDENRRNDIIIRSLEYARKFDWNISADQLWQSLVLAVNN